MSRVEGKCAFAAITPLNHPEVTKALLGYIPSSRRATLKDHAVQIRTVRDMTPAAREAFLEVGIEDDYRVAVLVRRIGFMYPVTVWEINPERKALLDYFDFVPRAVQSVQVNQYLEPESEIPTFAHSDEYVVLPAHQSSLRQTEILVPLMGLKRLRDAAAVTRREFFGLPHNTIH